MAVQKYKFLVFIGHASTDKSLTLRIAAILDSLGLATFVYEKYSRGGQNRFDVIKEKISECPYFVLLLTKRARRSEWVNQEIGFAVAKEREIIPLVEVSQIRQRRLPYFGFTELKDPINLVTNQPEDAIRELLRTLMDYAKRDRYWRGLIQLSCTCGWKGRKGVKDLTIWQWNCPYCQQIISVSPVTFE